MAHHVAKVDARVELLVVEELQDLIDLIDEPVYYRQSLRVLLQLVSMLPDIVKLLLVEQLLLLDL